MFSHRTEIVDLELENTSSNGYDYFFVLHVFHLLLIYFYNLIVELFTGICCHYRIFDLGNPNPLPPTLKPIFLRYLEFFLGVILDKICLYSFEETVFMEKLGLFMIL